MDDLGYLFVVVLSCFVYFWVDLGTCLWLFLLFNVLLGCLEFLFGVVWGCFAYVGIVLSTFGIFWVLLGCFAVLLGCFGYLFMVV